MLSCPPARASRDGGPAVGAVAASGAGRRVLIAERARLASLPMLRAVVRRRFTRVQQRVGVTQPAWVVAERAAVDRGRAGRGGAQAQDQPQGVMSRFRD